MFVEHCQKLNIHELAKQAKDQLLEGFIKSKISASQQGLALTFTECNFGGKRFWLVCPKCGKRVGTLYKKPTGELLLCRKCHGLRYMKTTYQTKTNDGHKNH